MADVNNEDVGGQQNLPGVGDNASAGDATAKELERARADMAKMRAQLDARKKADKDAAEEAARKKAAEEGRLKEEYEKLSAEKKALAEMLEGYRKRDMEAAEKIFGSLGDTQKKLAETLRDKFADDPAAWAKTLEEIKAMGGDSDDGSDPINTGISRGNERVPARAGQTYQPKFANYIQENVGIRLRHVPDTVLDTSMPGSRVFSMPIGKFLEKQKQIHGRVLDDDFKERSELKK